MTDPRKTARFQLRWTKEEEANIKAAAARRDMSASEFVRRSVRAVLTVDAARRKQAEAVVPYETEEGA